MFYQEPIMAAPLGAFSISPGVEFLRKTNPSSEEKKIVVACFCGPKNVKLGIFTWYSCSESIEMYKKCDARVKSQLLCL